MAELEFCVLGPLVVRSGGRAVSVPRGKQRALLVALLLKSGQVMSLDELARALWGREPPPSARVVVRNYVMRLRHGLGEAGAARIATRPPGYLIQVQDGELDLSRFEALLESARACARLGSWEGASRDAAAALALWRGEPLADVESEPLALQEVPRLEELRLQATETRIEADLRLGGHADVVPELQQLASLHPLREHLHALLMLALYRAGRQADALAAYQRARRVLVEELGAEPGNALRELHRQVLAGDDASLLSPRSGRPVAGGPGSIVPRELPGPVRHFTGRADELEELTRLIDQAGRDTPGTVVISAIAGTAGVGKTALAVHWAHRVADRFPHGQLYVNLRGYDPGRPVPPGEALAGFLRALGVAERDIPPEEDQRAARYRSLLAGRKMLVLLDNAASAEQVRPLLPGDPACVALVTSRDSLSGLVARDGAARLDLDVLPAAEAVSLLRALIGGRVDADIGAAGALAAECARLPLALRVAAELAAARPANPLADLVGELADQRRRLALLDAGGDSGTAVRAVFSWSCRHLDDTAARVFRLAGLHPGPDFDRYAIAVLTGMTAGQAGQVLDVLAGAYLVQSTAPGRYGMHDLLRAYASDQAYACDAAEVRRDALTRLFDYYLAAASAAVDTLVPAERDSALPAPAVAAVAAGAAAAAVAVPPLATPVAAHAWLDTEYRTLMAMAVRTASGGWPEHAVRLAAVLARYVNIGGHYPETLSVHAQALHAARHTGDRAGQADALLGMGMASYVQGLYEDAGSHYERALILYRELGHQAGQARALGNLGLVCWAQRRHEQAIGYHRQALALLVPLGDRRRQARTLGNLGLALCAQRRYREAAKEYKQARRLFREVGDRNGEAVIIANVGEVLWRQGRHQEAADHLQQAPAIFREHGDRRHEARALGTLGQVLCEQGHYRQALRFGRLAVAQQRELGSQPDQIRAVNSLAETLRASGRHSPARQQFRDALALARQAGDLYEQARAHLGLGHVCRVTGDSAEAERHWQEALTLYTSLGAPEAGQVPRPAGRLRASGRLGS